MSEDAAIIAMLIAQKQRALLGAFRQANATSPDSARTLEFIGVERSGVFNWLAKDRVLVQTVGNRWYLDEERLSQTRRGGRARLLITLAVVFVVGIVMALLITR